jgi:hypothetical protein
MRLYAIAASIVFVILVLLPAGCGRGPDPTYDYEDVADPFNKKGDVTAPKGPREGGGYKGPKRKRAEANPLPTMHAQTVT